MQDEFERYAEWRATVWDPGAPHAQTESYKTNVPEIEAGWRRWHAEADNAVRGVGGRV